VLNIFCIKLQNERIVVALRCVLLVQLVSMCVFQDFLSNLKNMLRCISSFNVYR
jgi:hypothetical protein